MDVRFLSNYLEIYISHFWKFTVWIFKNTYLSRSTFSQSVKTKLLAAISI